MLGLPGSELIQSIFKHLGLSTEMITKCHMTISQPIFVENNVLQIKQWRSSVSGRKSFNCKYCDRGFFRTASDLQKHTWIHEGIKPFKCHLCSHACRSRNNLSSHMLRHSLEKPFLCTECGKSYKSKTALRWHVRSHKHGKFKCNQ